MTPPRDISDLEKVVDRHESQLAEIVPLLDRHELHLRKHDGEIQGFEKFGRDLLGQYDAMRGEMFKNNLQIGSLFGGANRRINCWGAAIVSTLVVLIVLVGILCVVR